MTKNKTKKNNIFGTLYILCILFLIFLLVLTPNKAIMTFGQGVMIWATKILPGLLPFLILTNLLSYTNFTSTIGKVISPATKFLYNVGGVSGYVYIMSILSGYPIGAKLTSDLYKSGQISQKQAFTITSFTSTSGPLFIIGTVGIGFFNNQKIGLIILIAHYIGALLNGLIYRSKEQSNLEYNVQPKTSMNFLNDSMTNSIMSIMIVGGFVALFYMILNLLNSLNVFALPILLLEKIGVDGSITTAIISGIIEVTSGELALSKCGLNFNLSAILSSFLISFGGLSIHAQAYCFLKDFNMSYSKFLLQKITHAIISASVTFLILCIL